MADILSRAYAEVEQVGATGAKFNELVEAVRRAVVVKGCRSVEEIVDEERLSRWTVDRALERLVADDVLETRDAYRLPKDEDEPGRPPTQYHPKNTPRGEDFTHLLHRRAVDDDLL